MVPYPLQCPENPLILTSTCNGTVITAYLPSTVSQVHLPTGQKQFGLTQSFSKRNLNTLEMQWESVNIPLGSSIRYKIKFLITTEGNMATINPTQTTIKHNQSTINAQAQPVQQQVTKTSQDK